MGNPRGYMQGPAPAVIGNSASASYDADAPMQAFTDAHAVSASMKDHKTARLIVERKGMSDTALWHTMIDLIANEVVFYYIVSMTPYMTETGLSVVIVYED